MRFWKVLDQGEEKRPVWLGAVTYDRGVGVSHYTGAITHHIGADIDAERALLAADLEAAGMVDAKYQVTGIGPTLTGRNGGGDPYYTDGEVWILRLVVDCAKRAGPADIIPSPPATELKDQIWHWQLPGRLARQSRYHIAVIARTRSDSKQCHTSCSCGPWIASTALAMTKFNQHSPGLNFPPFPGIPSPKHSTRNHKNGRSRGPGIPGDPRAHHHARTKCCGRCIVRRSISIPTR